jgi:flavin-dependent dehydrogenase
VTSYDAIVIGAGPAGSTAALLLARAGWSVAIVEKAEFPRRKVCGEFISAPALSLLARVGVSDEILERAGPEVREVAVYAGERVIRGTMPRIAGEIPYGRALGREHLDLLMLETARRAGAVVWQPWRVKTCKREETGYVCCIDRKSPYDEMRLTAPVLIAAHGSWDTGGLPLPGAPPRAAPSDLFAFKAHFKDSALDAACMPLVAFPGGYGGLVTSDAGRTSFSCCIRRDALATCREETGGGAGAAVIAHVFGACRGVREALERATREEAWLGVGPLQPGIRTGFADGYCAIGNAMGEAHPIVAEGISMAIQSAWLLCERLIDQGRSAAGTRPELVSASYEKAYRRAFETRINASSVFALLAMHRPTASAVAGLLDRVPGLVSLGARWAGKAKPLYARA